VCSSDLLPGRGGQKGETGPHGDPGIPGQRGIYFSSIVNNIRI
jgi:hypothetical protein